ncbi:hypothetical protein [Mycobacterium heckeshornense]|uniref:phage tail protein n=1 Tax=Mycobacterium heckeshornense TaxID=110505 RepID=UPI000B2B3B12|nr:hypothetical protein [Mycobacterium heckeshornense]
MRDVDHAHASLHESHLRSHRDLDEFAVTANRAETSAQGLGHALQDTARIVGLIGPEGRAAAAGLEGLSKVFEHVNIQADVGGGHIKNFIKHIAEFEVQFGKFSGLALGGGALGGLAGLAGGAGVQGLVSMADAARQLSGALGLLPAVISGAALSMGTLKIAFHGVGDALKDMMADDPKKFLDDIKNMGPVAAQAMLQVAQFRDMFKLAGAAIQDSFFKQIIGDIQPLIQTWLPQLTQGMSQLSTMFGQAAHQFAGLLMQPQMMQAFGSFIANLTQGLQALMPAMQPLLDIFTRLTLVGSSFFAEIGQRITQMMTFFDGIVAKAQQSGALQNWIQSGIDAFSHLVNIAYLVGSAFNTILDTAEKFGAGGFLAWLEQVTNQFAAWTKSVGGQNALQQFFATTQQAMQAFMPMIRPIVDGFGAIFMALMKLGIAIAPGWQTFFNTFAQTMQQLQPAIIGVAPALNQFLTGLSNAFAQLAAQVGPQLPQTFMMLSNAFVALLPQLPPLVQIFLQLAQQVGPMLPNLFSSIAGLIEDLVPKMPILIGFIRDFVSALTVLIQISGPIINFFTALPQALNDFGPQIKNIFRNLAKDAWQWGSDLIHNFAQGMKDAIGAVSGAAGDIAGKILNFIKTHSPAKEGPLHDSSPDQMGEAISANFASGIESGGGRVAEASSRVAGQAASGLSAAAGEAQAAGTAASPTPGGRGAVGEEAGLLPDNIAQADTSILDAYLQHQFPDSRGLKGLAKDLGNVLKVFQDGFNLINQYALQPMFQFAQLMPGAKQQQWRKTVSDADLAKQQQQQLQRKALEEQNKNPTWQDVLGPAAAGGPSSQTQQTPLGLTPSSSKEDIQKAIIAAGKARGLSDADIQVALAVAAAESGFNPSANGGFQGSAGQVLGLYQQSPSSGWGTTQQVLDPNYAINAFYNAFVKQLQQHPTDPLLAAVLTQNPQLGGGAQGSDYWNAVAKQLGLAGNIMQTLGPGVTGPSWQQILSSGGVTGTLPGGTPLAAPGGPQPKPATGGLIGGVPLSQAGTPAPAAAPPGAQITQNPTSRATQVPNAPNVEAGIRAIGGLPTLYPTGGPGAYQVPQWAQALAQAFGLTASTYSTGGSLHQMGFAFDFNGPPEAREAFARFVEQNLRGQTLQLIYRGSRDYGIASGQITPPGYYAGDLPGHTDHVHWATDVPPIMLTADGKAVPVQGTLPTLGGAQTTGTSGGLVLPSGKTLDQLTDNTKQNTDVDKQLLDAYLAGNPALAKQISDAQSPTATDQQVKDTLTSIDNTINNLKTQDAAGNKNSIDALQNVQQQIAQEHGFTQQQNALQVAQSIAGASANAITSVIQAIQSGLDSLAATQDIADRLVYGIRNTEDINKLIDDVQKYITFASNVAMATGNILQLVGSIASAAGSGADEFGGSSAGQALSAAGTIAQLIGGVLQGVNAAIDFGQEVYHITGTYVGRFLSYLTAGLAGNPLMGNVRFLLNKNTGELLTYSTDNPLNKNTLGVPSWMNSWYDYSGGGNPNPQVNQQLNIYAGPGQSPGDMMNETMWLINTGGGQGAMAAVNF